MGAWIDSYLLFFAYGREDGGSILCRLAMDAVSGTLVLGPQLGIATEIYLSGALPKTVEMPKSLSSG